MAVTVEVSPEARQACIHNIANSSELVSGRFDAPTTVRLAAMAQDAADLDNGDWPADAAKKREAEKKAQAAAAQALQVNSDRHCHRPLTGQVFSPASSSL